MDPLTHSATGLFLSRAGLNRFSNQAPWILVLAANAPDIDILALFGGQLDYLNYHRHLTHSLIALPVMALLPVLAVRPFARQPFRWMGAYGIALIAVASHLLLDLTNSYGVLLLLPFSTHWFHWDLTAVVDLWIWAALLLALAGPVLGRLVNAEIGARARHPGRGFAIFALLFLVMYNGGRAMLHTRATAVLNARIYAGVAPQRVAALPSETNPFAWRGLAETPDFYSIQNFNLWQEFDPLLGTIFYKAEPSAAVKSANDTVVFRDFFRFSQYPFERVTLLADPEGATRVEAMDLRFGSPAMPSFVSTAVVDSGMRVIRAWFSFGAARPR